MRYQLIENENGRVDLGYRPEQGRNTPIFSIPDVSPVRFWIVYFTVLILFGIWASGKHQNCEMTSSSNSEVKLGIQDDSSDITTVRSETASVPANDANPALADSTVATSPQAQHSVPSKPYPPPPEFKYRSDFAAILSREGKTVGAELGVQRGDFANHMLYYWSTCTRYIMIDYWGKQENYEDQANVADTTHLSYYEETQKKLLEWTHKTTFMKMFTSEAAKYIADESLDFVYVDARHDYCGALEDIEMYWPKLKSDGIMGGHDFLYAREVLDQDWSRCADGSVQPGAVRGAVEDFAARHGLNITVGLGDPVFKSFAMRKP